MIVDADGQSPNGGRGLLFQVFVGVAAAALAVLQFLNLFGSLYTTVANNMLERPTDDAALAAAHAAAALTPWSSQRLALEGWVLAERGAADPAEAQYHRALALAPADALLWIDFALVLGRNRKFDLLEAATQRAAELAPASPTIRASLASIALSYWDATGAGPKAVWLEAIKGELRRDRQSFLDGVIVRGRAPVFCRDIAAAVSEVTWCRQWGIVESGCGSASASAPNSACPPAG